MMNAILNSLARSVAWMAFGAAAVTVIAARDNSAAQVCGLAAAILAALALHRNPG